MWQVLKSIEETKAAHYCLHDLLRPRNLFSVNALSIYSANKLPKKPARPAIFTCRAWGMNFFGLDIAAHLHFILRFLVVVTFWLLRNFCNRYGVSWPLLSKSKETNGGVWNWMPSLFSKGPLNPWWRKSRNWGQFEAKGKVSSVQEMKYSYRVICTQFSSSTKKYNDLKLVKKMSNSL